ncbi:WD40 repeat-like protein [Cristinia sonorae]|uniref:WD40 repeat-like protein n=1 Tax=Cristinia sonorae TaxID=1940300 RepID=A0A8K0XNS6_9AGAR|nr:WD40 repeat-like protein [Cristinia sonorae]
MPVAVDPTPAMAASKQKHAAPSLPTDIPLPDTPKTAKKPRKKQPSQTQDAPPTPGSSKSAPSSSWTWRSLTVSSSSRVPLLFTKDGSYFFSVNGPSVKIYSVATGRVVSTLYPLQHTPAADIDSEARGTITCMALNPHNAYQLITGSLDGVVRVWDFVDAVLLKTLDVGKPVHHLAVHERFRDEVFVSVARPAKRVNSKGNPTANGDNNSVMRVVLKATDATVNLPVQTPSESHTIGKTRGSSGLAFSPSGSWLVVTAGHKAYVASTSNLKAGFTKFVSPDKLTCLAFHPSEEYFATGDEKGVVRLWYCLNDSVSPESTGTEKKATTTTLHWHAHAVSSLAFTANGAYLLTGGEEAVLVIWQLHTGKKEFVPRLGAPIINVAISNATTGEESYLVGLADASFVFVRSGTLKVSRTIARIKIDPAISNNRPTLPSSVPLTVHSLTSTLVLPSSHPSMIQMYSPTIADLISELEVSPSNKISRRDDKQLDPPRVERAVVSENGKWMATVDSRAGDEAHRGEVYLKLWSWEKKGGYWTLNTRIDRPHGLKNVTAVTFRPPSEVSSLQLATTGADGAIKIWRLRQVSKEGKNTEEFWVAQATLNFRSEIPSDASWSLDGSLLAVSLGPYIGLYDAETNMLSSVLTSPECPLVNSAQFVGKSSRYVAAVGPRDLVLWDVVTQSVLWHYRSFSGITRLASRNDSDSFLLLEKPTSLTQSPTTKVTVFNTSSSTPIATQSLPFHFLGVTACPPGWTQGGETSSLALLGVTHSWNVVLLGDNITLPDEIGATHIGLRDAGAAVKRTLFDDIFGASLFVSPSVQSSAQSPNVQSSSWKGKDVERVFDAPAYLMPPLEALFDPLVQSFFVERGPEKKFVKDEGEGADDRMDEDEKDGPILVGSKPERMVGKDEMAGLVNLFKSYAIRPSNTTININGIHKASAQINGVTSHSTTSTPSSKAKPKTAVPPSTSKPSVPSPVPSPAAASPGVRAGSKRKKSLG